MNTINYNIRQINKKYQNFAILSLSYVNPWNSAVLIAKQIINLILQFGVTK